MLKINIHSHAGFKALDGISAIRREISSNEIDYYVVAALDLRLYDGKTPQQIKEILANGNKFSANFYAFVDDTNENVARLREQLGAKIIPFAYLDPRQENALQQAEYWVKKRSFMGLKLYPPIGFYPDEPELLPFFAFVERLKVPILLHMGRVLPHPKLRMKYAKPMFLEGVAVNCPDLKIIVGHFARPWTYEAYCLALGFPNVYIDLTTGGSEDREMIKRVIRNLGAKRLAFGTDNILNTAEKFRQMREEFKQDGVNDNDLEMIFGGSAAEILGLQN
jgi:predicted TIM-barrel fold metal-dependent hydrolase